MNSTNNVPEAITQGIVAIASINSSPEVAVTAAVLSPMIKDVSTELYSRLLGDLQSSRMAKVLHQITDKIRYKLSNGEKLRSDSFIEKENGIMLKQVLEGILLTAIDEFENKKLNSYSDLFSNLCFDQRIIFEQAIALVRIIKRLSYRQLCIIALAQHKALATASWDVKFKESSSLNDYTDLFSEILALYDLRILQQIGIGISLTITNLALSQFGKIIYEELNLAQLPKVDVDEIDEYIVRINSL